jgi:hypothetical protein
MRTVWQLFAGIGAVTLTLAAIAAVLHWLLILADRRSDLPSVRAEQTRRALLDEGLSRTLNRSDR